MITPMLVASVTHITEDAKEWMDQEDCNELMIFEKSTFGWFISIPRDLRSMEGLQHVPESLRMVVNQAGRLGCGWVMFDCDGPVIDGLITYN